MLTDMEQLELFEPIPEFLVGVRVGDEIQQYEVGELTHETAADFIRKEIPQASTVLVRVK